MSNIRLQQTLIIGAIILLLAFLFTRNVKGLIKPKETENKPAAQVTDASASVLNIEQVSAVAKNMISNSLSTEIAAIEEEYKNAGEGDKVKIAARLSQKWEDVEQYAPSALYLEVIANKQPSLASWLKSGDGFLKAYERASDSVTLQPALLKKANASYAAALAIDSNDIAAKTGLGITIVNGMGMPMEGIAMLLDVVKRDPQNLHANMQLGVFSIKSGQFDKAITRFKQVIEIKPSSEAYFYLATSYESLNRNTEAVAAYLQSKKLAANPTLSKFIDKKVAELKK